MKKLFALILFSSFLWCGVYATHNKGGEITFKKISGFTYEVTITTYTYTRSAADRSELEIDWGDGQTGVIKRTGVLYYPNYTKINTYTMVHEYPGYGIYKMSVADPNRNRDILNIPNSENIMFYIESLLVLNQKISNNFSIEFGVVPTMVAECGKEYRFNVSAYLLDDYPLHYELVPCKGHNGEDIEGYEFPDNMELNPETGEIVWQVPQNSGTYNIAVKVSRLVDGNSLGYCIRDFQLNSFSDIQSNYLFKGHENWPKNESGSYEYSIYPNDSLEFELTYKDDKATEIELSSFSEIYLIEDSAVFETIKSDSAIIGTFKWSPNISHVREYPYVVVFTGNSRFNFQSPDLIDHNITLAVYVKNSTTFSDNYLKLNEINDGVIIYPNPVQDWTNVKLEYNLSIYKNLNFKIYDMNGRNVYSKYDIHSKIFTISRGELNSGTYIYILESNSELTAMGKIVVK